MLFCPYSSIEIPKKRNGLIIGEKTNIKTFWHHVDMKIEMGLSNGVGCYIFAIRAGKGRLTEAGPLPEHYNLHEMPTKDYLKPAKQNVLDSDGTVVFSHGDLKGGSKRTVDFAVKLKRQWLHVDLAKNSPEEAADMLTA